MFKSSSEKEVKRTYASISLLSVGNRQDKRREEEEGRGAEGGRRRRGRSCSLSLARMKMDRWTDRLSLYMSHGRKHHFYRELDYHTRSFALPFIIKK